MFIFCLGKDCYGRDRCHPRTHVPHRHHLGRLRPLDFASGARAPRRDRRERRHDRHVQRLLHTPRAHRVRCSCAKSAAPTTPPRRWVTSPVLAAYPATPEGKRAEHGSHVALELPEVRLTKRVEGGVMGSRKIDNCFRITQTATIPTAADPLVGLVYDACAGDICPALDRWHEAEMTEAVDGIKMEYGYFEPDFEPAAPAISGHFTSTKPKPEKAALIIYLHGARRGQGRERGRRHPRRPARARGPGARLYRQPRDRSLAEQDSGLLRRGGLGCSSRNARRFWMDNGVEQLGHSNQSIYARATQGPHRRVHRRARRPYRHEPHRCGRSFPTAAL